MAVKKNEAGLYEQKIEGRCYEFTKWGAESALDSLMDLAAICGKPLGAGISQMFTPGQKGLDSELDGNFIGHIILLLSDAFFARKALCRDLIYKLTSGVNVMCDGVPVKNFNLHYSGCLEEVFVVARANLEVQYERFFSVAKDAVDNLGRAKPPPSTPETSTGSIGGP